jgi:superfamily I DNA/RNA helicase
MSKHRRSNFTERKLVRTLDDIKLYDELMPAIRAAAIAGGGADQILKKAEALAVLKIVELIGSPKDDVALKASIEVTNRSLGKPVERTLSIYGDLSRMNEKDIDAQILKAIEKSGAQKLIDAVVEERPRLKQRRKPRKAKLIEEVVSLNGPKEEQPTQS